MLEHLKEAGGTVIGIDFQTPLSQARERLGKTPVQGNLDPTVLLSPKAVIGREARRVLQEAGGMPGHIFNLGHGILPPTPVEAVQALAALVHEHRS